MFPQDPTTWILYVALALILGALGSGLWEVLFKPGILKTRQIVLKIITLGMTSTRDSIYREIAARPLQKPSLLILTLIIFTLAGGLGFSGSHFKKMHFDESKNTITESSDKEASSQKDGDGFDDAISEENRKNIESKIKLLKIEIHELQKNISSMILLLILMSFSFTVSAFTKCKYIHSAICYFDQLFCICLPFITQEKERNLLSSFAQIKSKEDYYAIIEELKNIATLNNIQSIPKFTLF